MDVIGRRYILISSGKERELLYCDLMVSVIDC